VSGATRTGVAGSGLAVAPGAVAPVGVRVGAFTLDVVAVGAVGAVAFAVARLALGAVTTAVLVADAVTLAFGIGQWVAEATTGATLGSALLRIRTLSATTGRPAGLARILLRQLVVGLGSLVCGLGAWVVAASGAWDKGVAQRGWHDKAAGTVVLRADAVGGAVPADVAGSYASAVARAVGAPPAAPTRVRLVAAGSSEAGADVAPDAPPLAGAVVTPPTPAAAVVAPAQAAPVPEPTDDRAPTAATPPAGQQPVPALSAAATPTATAADVPAWSAPVVPAFPVTAQPGPATTDLPNPYTAATPIVPVPVPVPVPEARPAGPARLDPATGLIAGPPGFDAPAETGATPPPSRDVHATAPAPGVPAPSTPAATTAAAVPPPTAAPTPVWAPTPASVPAPTWASPETSARRVTDDLGDLEHTRLRPAAPATTPAPALRLAFDTGEVVDVVGDGLVGRNPSAQDGVAHLVAIDDPARSVSKVHLAFGPGGAGQLWVVDRGSTNGTVLVRPDGTRATLPAGARATIGAGWAVRFGERTVRLEAR